MTTILFNKPYGVLPQFTDQSPKARPVLADFIPVKNVYPAGRLDLDSEGLMVLTDDGALQARIADPKFKLEKVYYVQVEGAPRDADLQNLRDGVMLKDGMTKPARAGLMEPPDLWERDPPIRVRKTVPDQWLELGLREGRNRQVRRMTAAIGFPTLRLVRMKIGDWDIGDLHPGEWRKV